MSVAHRAQISEWLGTGDRPCAVLSHSPLLAVGNFVDPMSFHDRAFMADFARHERVKLVLSGHAHISRGWRYRGAIHLTAPSLSYGIGTGVGYHLVGLTESDVAWQLLRRLPGRARDLIQGEDASQAASLDPIEVASYESSPLCNPSIWPWRVQPESRR